MPDHRIEAKREIVDPACEPVLKLPETRRPSVVAGRPPMSREIGRPDLEHPGKLAGERRDEMVIEPGTAVDDENASARPFDARPETHVTRGDEAFGVALPRVIYPVSSPGGRRGPAFPVYHVDQYSELNTIGSVACVWPRCCGRKLKSTIFPLP